MTDLITLALSCMTDEPIDGPIVMMGEKSLQAFANRCRQQERDALKAQPVQEPIGDEYLTMRCQELEQSLQEASNALATAHETIADMRQVEPMNEIAQQFAHRLALELECVLADRNVNWNRAIKRIGEYRSAMNAIHEQHSPTFMGEPLLEAQPVQEPATGSIKPCPFCGSVAIDFREGSTFRWIAAGCDQCGATCGEVRVQTSGEGNPELWAQKAKQDAIKEWNTREAQPLWCVTWKGWRHEREHQD